MVAMVRHNCRQLGQNNELLYICSRCRKCYCKHKYVFFEQAEEWKVKCPNGKFQELIVDGRLQGGPGDPGWSDPALKGALIDLEGRVFDWNEELGEWIRRQR